MATDEEYRARCLLQAMINKLEDRLEQSSVQLEQWQDLARKAFSDDHGYCAVTQGAIFSKDQACTACDAMDELQRRGTVQTKNRCPDCGKPIDIENYLSLANHKNCALQPLLTDKDTDSRRTYGSLRFLPDDQGYEYVGEVVVEDRDSPSWAASLGESDKGSDPGAEEGGEDVFGLPSRCLHRDCGGELIATCLECETSYGPVHSGAETEQDCTHNDVAVPEDTDKIHWNGWGICMDCRAVVPPAEQDAVPCAFCGDPETTKLNYRQRVAHANYCRGKASEQD